MVEEVDSGHSLQVGSRQVKVHHSWVYMRGRRGCSCRRVLSSNLCRGHIHALTGTHPIIHTAEMTQLNV